jgi:hypothetical protein
MEEKPKKEDLYPKLLHLISNEGEWKPIIDQKVTSNINKLLDQEERELELKLGPPGREEKLEKSSLQSLGYSLNALNHSSSVSHGAKRGFSDVIKSKSQGATYTHLH